MKQLLNYENQFSKESDWKNLALLKLCFGSMGLMLGIATPKKAKKAVAFGAMGVFIATYVPLMLKLLNIAARDKENRCSHSSCN